MTLDITDNDNANSREQEKISVASTAVTAILNLLPSLNPDSRNQLNSDVERYELPASNTIEVEILPTISIVTESPTILEGETARFKMQSDIPVKRNIEVLIEIISNSNIYNGDDLQVVNLQTGQNSTYFNLQTVNDDEPEYDEHIQVLIKDGSGYNVTEAPNHSAIVNISDILDHNRISDSMTEAYNEIIPIMLNSIGTRSLETLTTRSNVAFTNSNSSQFELNRY